MMDTAHLRFNKDTEIIFCSGVGSFRSGTKRFDFLMAVGSPDDFGDESGEFLDGHVLGESMVVDPVWTIVFVSNDGGIF